MGTIAGNSFEWVNMTVGVILQLAVTAVILFAAAWLYKNVFGPKPEPKPEVQVDTAMEILKRRYARGKITTEEFRLMRRELSGERPVTEHDIDQGAK